MQFNVCKYAFNKAETDEQRAEILHALLLNIAAKMGLQTITGALINVKFEKLGWNTGGEFRHSDPEKVYLDTQYIKKDASLKWAVSTYLHECAHLICFNFLENDSKHAFLFFAVNLAMNIKFDAILRSQNPMYQFTNDKYTNEDFFLGHSEYSWSESSLRIYNIYEDQDLLNPAKIDAEKLSMQIGEATLLAFRCTQNNENSMYSIIGTIAAFYKQKLKAEAEAEAEAEARKPKKSTVRKLTDIFINQMKSFYNLLDTMILQYYNSSSIR